MIRVSANPAIDTVIKLVTVAVAMFAFVFVVMVPLYDVLCDITGLNGRTADTAASGPQGEVAADRLVTCAVAATAGGIGIAIQGGSLWALLGIGVAAAGCAVGAALSTRARKAD